MRKQFKQIMLLMCSVLALCGCSPGRSGEQYQQNTLRIGVSVYDGYDTLLSDITDAMNEWAREKERQSGCAVLLDVVSAGQSQIAQNDQVAAFIDKGYDVVCVNLVDRTDPGVIIDKAKNADVPVVFFNREPVAEDLARWDKLCYVGADAEQSGSLQAQLVTAALEDKDRFKRIDRSEDRVIQYVILEGEIGHQDALIRTQVSIEEIQKAGFSVEKIGDEIANWNRNQAESKMKQLLDQYPNQIEMVIANDDDMALGALDAVNHRDAQLPLIVGVNGTDEALEMVKQKKLEGTVYSNPKKQAEKIMEQAFLLSGRQTDEQKSSADRTFYVDYQLVNYDNVQDFIRRKE
ncbi:MAG: galactose ABC transporter substrate-binding protein [Lachnospiraceae bacterium]|nr:galactose ABC transporter substrate-binding protein [Lachnospiraceae bacterium]